MGDSDTAESRHRKSKKHRKKRPRREEEGDDDDYNKEKKRRRKEKYDSRDSDDSYSAPERRKRKKRSKKHKKSSRKYDSDSSSVSSRKRKRKKKHRKKHRTSSSEASSDNGVGGQPSFGKYGIIRESDMNKMKRSFDVWLAEVKGIPSFSGSRWELQELFKTYMEDFNTATLPHKKYYNYDKWEMDEYQKQQKQADAKASVSTVLQDQRRHELEQKAKAQRQREQEQALTQSLMSREKIQEMKRQADLRSQMQVAYRSGDMENYNRLKDKLEPGGQN